MSEPTEKQTPLPCPFCGGTDIDPSYALTEAHGVKTCSPGCMDCGAMADTLEQWNTRAPSAELAAVEAQAAAMREWIEETEIEQFTTADGKILRKWDMLSCAGGKTILNQLDAWRLEVQKLRDINKRACEDWADDDTAIKDECKAFGIDVEGDSYGVPTMVECVRQLAERLRKAEALATQLSAEREHNAMEALAMRAERDRLRAENESFRKSLSPTTTEKPNQQ